MKKLLSVLLAFCLIMGSSLLFSACGEEKEPVKVILTVENYGEITLELYPEHAPITVDNFLSLVDDGFYDGLTFHRIYKGFMIQGGDPEGDGTGDSGKNIKGEFSANGVDNPLSHTRGTISMARGAYSMDSASCQFFICDADSTFLDGQYAAFGKVIAGMDVVDAIASVAVSANPLNGEMSVPNETVTIESIRRA
ncbi:MAG: peptidylprolyl isomerase [Ruminococcaceae bacterium]|nr:peptidylprolyl isomerase [Oscillospiraceae bacterium]